MAQPFAVDLSPAARSRVVSMSAIGAFSWRWPEGIENYERGWVAIADIDGTEFQIRHGIGQRDAFGRSRIRAVTWVEGEPLVEGVGADDFEQSQALLSLIKITRKHLRPGDEVPPEYAGFSNESQGARRLADSGCGGRRQVSTWFSRVLSPDERPCPCR